MLNLTRDDLLKAHDIVQQRFNITPGIKSEGLLDSIVLKPDTVLHGKECFPDIYTKAASIMETMRWHAFVDGNKRTLLLATQSYLKLNGYYCLLPISSVRYTVEISKTLAPVGEEQEVTDKLIREISEWLVNYVTKSDNHHEIFKILNRFSQELQNVSDLNKDDPEKARKILEYWMAVDIYPEYGNEIDKVIKFIGQINFNQGF